jgi:hypothetical protein
MTFDVEEHVPDPNPFDLSHFARAMAEFHRLIYAHSEQVDLVYLIAAFTTAAATTSNSARYRAIFKPKSKHYDLDRVEAAVRNMLAKLETSTDPT